MTPLGSAWARLLATLDAAGWPATSLRSPADEQQLTAAEVTLGLEVHRDLGELYQLTGGVDEEAWATRTPAPPYLLPTLRFPGVETAAALTAQLREEAGHLDGADEIWHTSWFAPFHLWSDEVVVVDGATGEVWLVWWEATRIEKIADSLASYVDQCTAFVRDSGCQFDTGSGLWTFPDGYDGPTSPIPEESEPLPSPPPSAHVSMSVEGAFEILMDAHRAIGSRVPHRLRPPVSEQEVAEAERAIGFRLHPDVRSLLTIADGIDTDQWPHSRWAPEILPRLKFPPLSQLVQEWRVRRDWTSRWEADGRAWWGSEWFPVFVYAATVALVVDCGSPEGTTWRASWETNDLERPRNAERISPAAPDLASFLVESASKMRAADLEPDQETGRIRWVGSAGEQFV